jgi:hypothetical protein
MNRPATLLTAVALLAVAPAAEAATFQEGSMKFTVSGSWVTSGPTIVDCQDRSSGETTTLKPTITERVTFRSTSAGRVAYKGLVGRSIFFGRIGATPKVKLSVSRGPNPPANCSSSPAPDCGPKALAGVANPEFEGPLRMGGKVDLRFDFAKSPKSFRFADPFRQCPEARPGWFAAALGNSGDAQGLQAAAIGNPSVKRLYGRRSQTFSGSATQRFKGDPGIGLGPSSATLKMKVKVTRKVTKSQPAFGS